MGKYSLFRESMTTQIDYEFHSAYNDSYAIPTRRIVRMLSENSRISLTEMADRLKLSRRTAKGKLDKLEKALDIRYTLELDDNMIGTTIPHVAVLEFEKKPDYDYVAKLLKKSYIPQLAFTVKGRNLMYIYAMAVSTRDYVYWDNTMSELLSEWGVNWYSSEVIHKQLGFVPLRNELIARLNINLNIRELLKVLNDDSRASIQELSKKVGRHFNSVSYTMEKLIDSKLVKRFTLTTSLPEGSVPISFMLKLVPKKNFESAAVKARAAVKSDDKDTIASRYILTAPLIGSWDYLALGLFDNYKTAQEHCASYLKQVYGPHMKSIVFNEIDRVLVGRLPVRSIDSKSDYNLIDWTADIERL